MIQDELPCAWRFVDNTDKLTKNLPCANCDQEEYKYKTDVTLLPPFIWRGPSFFTPQTFWLRTLDAGADINLASELSNLITFTIGSYSYVCFKGDAFTVIGSPLATGLYQCEVSDGINTIYSEPILICSDLAHCIRLMWTNTCDLAGIPYAYLQNLGGAFLNIMFIEAPILPAEYETEKEESINLLRQRTNLYQTQERTLRFETIGPVWVVKALKAMELHDNTDIYVQWDSDASTNLYVSDNVQDVEVSVSDLDKSECGQQLEIRFKQDEAIISGICCVNETPEPCLVNCIAPNSVVGFTPEGECVDGAYYIDDIDSGVIVQCVEGVLVNVSTTCTYVHNSTDGNYYYYNGDFWAVTPDLDLVSLISVSMTHVQVNLDGFTIPGTWVYIHYSCNNVSFTQYPIPFTAAQLAAGISIIIPKCNDTYYFYCSSRNHTCTYDNSDTISVTPG